MNTFVLLLEIVSNRFQKFIKKKWRLESKKKTIKIIQINTFNFNELVQPGNQMQIKIKHVKNV